MASTPDFYLACSELVPPLEPRECYVKERLTAEGREDHLLVQLWPPLKGHYGASDVSEVILAVRHTGQTLFPIREWPVYVYVCRLKSGSGRSVFPGDLQILLWGELYPDCDEARRAARP